MKTQSIKNFFAIAVLLFSISCNKSTIESTESVSDEPTTLMLEENLEEGTISIFRQGEKEPILVQNAKDDFRPYIHPIVAPDGKGLLTEYSPGHHKHQTGLYWGFTRVNERDYFHNPQGIIGKKWLPIL
jgi:hypothetical protein